MKARLVICVIALTLAACGAFGAGTAGRSALEIVAPLAADALAKMIRERYGTDVDKESAGCYPLPEFTTDEDGFDYVLCRAKPINGSE